MSSYNKYPIWTARFWHGMRLTDWWRLVSEYGFRIHWTRWPMTVVITGVALINSTLAALQWLLTGRQIARTEINSPPVFIVGHWRSGTTMLHEMMVCDEQFHYPNTYQCFAPHHFLVSEWWASRLFWFLAPKQRPMDNMKAGMRLPQEDEFALMNLGVPSPYRRMAFPNEPPRHLNYLNFHDVSEAELASWKDSLMQFAKTLTTRRQAPLVFKSPTHTGRIETLAKMFPGARFIHIARHPHALFPSTMRLWRALDFVQGLQVVDEEADVKQREDYVLECFERMYQGYDSFRSELNESQLFEVRYEDLVAQPMETMAKIYEQLDLGDFEAARPGIQAYLDQRKDYKVNPHPELPPHISAAIEQRWQDYLERYGYEGS